MNSFEIKGWEINWKYNYYDYILSKDRLDMILIINIIINKNKDNDRLEHEKILQQDSKSVGG